MIKSIVLGLAIVLGFGFSVSAHAQEISYQETPYFDIDGTQTIVMRLPSLSGQAGQFGKITRLLVDQVTGNEVLLSRGLASGGDTVWRDKNGRIYMRKTGNGGIIYYPNYRRKGIPLLARAQPEIGQALPHRLEDWAKAYPYKGREDSEGALKPKS